MNFSVTVDDHLLGITHVIRGKDHIANTRRQRFIFDYFGWEVPVYRHYGRMGIEGVVLSTSQMRLGIREGTYTGWDDVHLGTLRALARRGISPDAVRNAVLDIGIGETDISFSWDNLYSQNKAIIDPQADRYFFVPDPVKLAIEGAPKQVAHAALHPGDASRGSRILPFSGSVLIPRAELTHDHPIIRLKDLFNVTVAWNGEAPALAYAGKSLADARVARAPIIQWLPAGSHIPCTLIHPERNMTGACEPGVSLAQGKVVQFERVGFARIDSAGKGGVVAYFTHR
jgi:glutamyl-tRNA synthetase